MSIEMPYRTPAEIADAKARTLVPSSRPAHVLARLLVAFAVLITGVLFAPWQQTVQGYGRVVAFSPTERQQNVEAPIEGRVIRWHVREGSRVVEGDPLLELSDNDPAIMDRLRDERTAVVARVAAAQSRVESLESRITFLTQSRESAIAAASQRVRMASDRSRAAQQAQDAAEALRHTNELNLARQRALTREGLASTRALELAELDAVRARTEVERARAALAAARNEESALRQDQIRVGNDVAAQIDDARASRATAQAEIANGNAELARIDVRLARQSTMRIPAPRTGTVLRLIGGQGGEMVRAGDPVVTLVPDTDARAVELWVDGNDVPLLSEGREVRIQFEGWPALQFSGWPSVAVGTFPARVALIDATDNGRGRFRVLVVPNGRDPWPAARYLRQGVRAHGWILLNRVSVAWELWRNFNGFPPTVSPSEPGSSSSSSSGSSGSSGGSYNRNASSSGSSR